MTSFKRTGGDDFPTHLKCLITGDPKTGKTSFLGTVPNIVILDTEPQANNMMSIAHLNVPVATITSSMDLEQIKLQLTDPSLRQMLAQSLGMPTIEALALDTLDSLQAILKRDRMREQHTTKFLRDDWGWLKEEMTALLTAFTSLPMHVFFTVHTKTETLGDAEKGDSRTVVLPGLEGAIARSVAGMVGYSLMTFRRQEVNPDGSAKTNYLLRAEGDETYGFLGNRAAGKLPEVVEPTFRTLLYFAELARKEAASQTAQAQQQQAAIAAQVAQQQIAEVQTSIQTPAPTPSATATAATAPAAPAAQDVVRAPDQPAPPQSVATAPPTPVGQAPVVPVQDRPADTEPVNAAALGHIKHVYDQLGIEFPEELARSRTLGDARNLVKMWKAIQEDHAKGAGTPGQTPQDEMLGMMETFQWLPQAGATVKAEAVAVEPKVDGTIEQVRAFVGDDRGRAQQAFDVERDRERPRATLLDWLVARGAMTPETATTQVQTAVENDAAGQEPASVTPPPAEADAPVTEQQAISTVTEVAGGTVVEQIDTEDGPCEVCGNPVNDLDIARLSKVRYGQWLCVDDYVRRGRAK